MKNRLVLFLLLIATTAHAVKILYGPYLQMVNEHEATIVWVTDKKTLSWVEIAPQDSLHFYAVERPKIFETYLGRKVLGTVHKVKIRNLNRNTEYRYRVCSKEVVEEADYHITYGKTVSTNVFTKKALSFRTRDREKKEINFRVINDIHGDNQLINNLLKGINKENTDFVLFNGDMVSHMDNETQLFEGFINSSVKLFAAEIPFYMIRGNHESRGKFAKHFMEYFPTPTQLPYYTFKEGPVFFIVMDGGEDKPDSDVEYYDTADFDRYREEQGEWLKKVVESEEFQSAPFKVAVIHVPPVQDTWHGPLHTKKTFLPILNEAGIDLMLCAHLHRHAYNKPNTDGAKFPILINSNTHVVKVHANSSTMDVRVEDGVGKVVKSLSYRRK